MTKGCINTDVTNLCSDTGVVPTPPSLLCVVPEPSGKFGRLSCGRNEAYPEIPTGSGIKC